MMFLRNRVIEAGICGGLNLGWNLKRGGPELSIDFIAEKREVAGPTATTSRATTTTSGTAAVVLG